MRQKSISKIKQTFLISVIMKNASGYNMRLKIVTRVLSVRALAVTGVARTQFPSHKYTNEKIGGIFT